MSRLKAVPPLSQEQAAPADPFTPEPEAQAATEKPVAASEAPAPATGVTTEQLLSLIATLTQQNAEANQKLADAIIETTKPRAVIKDAKELAREANEKLFEENARILAKRRKEAQKYEQNNCDHIAGCSPLSEERDIRGRTSILWHTTDVGVDTGICLVCQKFFRPGDPVDGQGHDYSYWRKKPSMCRVSKAGVRTFMDPVRAMDESYLHDS